AEARASRGMAMSSAGPPGVSPEAAVMAGAAPTPGVGSDPCAGALPSADRSVAARRAGSLLTAAPRTDTGPPCKLGRNSAEAEAAAIDSAFSVAGEAGPVVRGVAKGTGALAS